jgi:lipopolysaccharide/colanic/teichoic acid biosynthesis glycosyltransferase
MVLLRHGSPILFRQTRPGYRGKPFKLIKFRTMSDTTDAQGRPLEDAVRLTPLGRWMRMFSLDELPELYNILHGDMSIVGPRPLLMEYIPLYSPEQARRHDVHPGLTGWAQINGRNALSWQERFKLDLWYVDNRSFWLDLRIILITLWRVLTRQGITQPGRATTDYFTGNED